MDDSYGQISFCDSGETRWRGGGERGVKRCRGSELRIRGMKR